MKKILKWLKRQRAFRQSFDELNNLTDHQLKDIGIERPMINKVVEKLIKEL